MRSNYKRKAREDYSEYESIRSRRYSREGRRALERKTFIRDEEDGYHFHVDVNLNKEFLGRITKIGGRIFSGILDYIDKPEDDRERFIESRDRRSYRGGSYPERDRRR